ncbi:MAG: Rid family detoxifying hydrolase [Burkholderiaceae bacterium]|nr:Rid family detoxifying hydrolase [Burkholderiaceae bacterium]
MSKQVSPKQIISTPHAPAAVGPYSQAVQTGNLVFLSGQIGMDPQAKTLAAEFEAQVRQAFKNMLALVEAAGGKPEQLIKLTLFVLDMAKFPIVNQIMSEMLPQPYPARSTLGVASLPLGAQFEVEAILSLP